MFWWVRGRNATGLARDLSFVESVIFGERAMEGLALLWTPSHVTARLSKKSPARTGPVLTRRQRKAESIGGRRAIEGRLTFPMAGQSEAYRQGPRQFFMQPARMTP